MSKRELIEPHPGDKRYVRRDDPADQRQHAKHDAGRGQGDRGDRQKH